MGNFFNTVAVFDTTFNFLFPLRKCDRKHFYVHTASPHFFKVTLYIQHNFLSLKLFSVCHVVKGTF